jgi:hypothetical protein
MLLISVVLIGMLNFYLTFRGGDAPPEAAAAIEQPLPHTARSAALASTAWRGSQRKRHLIFTGNNRSREAFANASGAHDHEYR